MKKITTTSSTITTGTVTTRKNKAGSLRTLAIEAGLAAVLAAAPIFFGASSSWTAMFLSSALFFLFCLSPDAMTGLPRPLFKISAVLFLFAILQTAFFSLNRYASCGEILKWFSLACFFCLAWKLPLSSVLKLAFIAAGIGVVEVLYGVWEVYSGHEHVLWAAKKNHIGFVTGTYFNRNHLAGLLELCLGLCTGGFVKAFYNREKMLGTVSMLAFCVLAAGLFLTGSRMGVLSFAVSFSAVFLAGFFKKDRKASFPLILLLIAGLPALIWGLHPWLSRWTELPLLSSDGQRLQAWKDTLDMIRYYPLTGIGLGAFEWVFPRYQSASLVMAWDHAHNDYLELIVELGIPGFILLASFFVILIKSCLSGPALEDAGMSGFERGLTTGILSFLIHGLADFNFSVMANVIMFIFLLAVLLKIRRGPA